MHEALTAAQRNPSMASMGVPRHYSSKVLDTDHLADRVFRALSDWEIGPIVCEVRYARSFSDERNRVTEIEVWLGNEKFVCAEVGCNRCWQTFERVLLPQLLKMKAA